MTIHSVDRFLALKCSSDILNVVRPVQNMSKEISEVYTILKAIRKTIPPDESYSYRYRVLDLCAGNGLLGVTLAHLFHFESVVSLDKRVPDRNWGVTRGYSYFDYDINSLERNDVEGTIIVANHPCKSASHIVDVFCEYNAKALILMPCCTGKLSKSKPDYILKQLGDYASWCIDLYERIVIYSAKNDQNIDVKICEDKSCLSPKNVVISAIRKG